MQGFLICFLMIKNYYFLVNYTLLTIVPDMVKERKSIAMPNEEYIMPKFFKSQWFLNQPSKLYNYEENNSDLVNLIQELEKRSSPTLKELKTEESQRQIRSPLGTMRFGKRSGPLGTMRFGKRGESFATIRFNKQGVTDRLGTMRFGKRENSFPLTVMQLEKRQSPLGTMRFGKRSYENLIN